MANNTLALIPRSEVPDAIMEEFHAICDIADDNGQPMDACDFHYTPEHGLTFDGTPAREYIEDLFC